MPKERFVFAHLADAHVGAWPRNPRFRAALRTCLLKAIGRAAELRIEFLLISGDLFHTPVPEPSEAAPIAAALRRLVDQGTRIYAIYGSHDYVAHRTSWLDVLAEAGVFARVAPEAVRAEGTRWTLPFLTDEPTGARIAGISGRSHGLDREYFRGVDSEAFRAAPGFHVFQFHAAIEEYLPEGLREHIAGIRRADLPAGCQYYAGGHIHAPYLGEGPEGGTLVNPGTLFGTSIQDLRTNASVTGRHGLAIVRVGDRMPKVEFYDPFSEAPVVVRAVDVTGRSAEELARDVAVATAHSGAATSTVAIDFTGTLPPEMTLAQLPTLSAGEVTGSDAAPVYVDYHSVELSTGAVGPPKSEAEIEQTEFHRLSQEAGESAPWALGEEGERRMRELLAELGTPKGDGEARADYIEARRAGALRLLDVRRAGPR